MSDKWMGMKIDGKWFMAFWITVAVLLVTLAFLPEIGDAVGWWSL